MLGCVSLALHTARTYTWFFFTVEVEAVYLMLGSIQGTRGPCVASLFILHEEKTGFWSMSDLTHSLSRSVLESNVVSILLWTGVCSGDVVTCII